jgi:hypothetical protein
LDRDIVFAQRTAILQFICDLIIRQFAERRTEWPVRNAPGATYQQLINNFCGYSIKSAVFSQMREFLAWLKLDSLSLLEDTTQHLPRTGKRMR